MLGAQGCQYSACVISDFSVRGSLLVSRNSNGNEISQLKAAYSIQESVRLTSISVGTLCSSWKHGLAKPNGNYMKQQF
jgi:hypothetical protein